MKPPGRNPPRVSLMRFSSSHPIGGKSQASASTNPFGGKKVNKISHDSSNPSDDTSAFNQPFRLKPVSPRREPAKTRKRSYEHGKRFADPRRVLTRLGGKVYLPPHPPSALDPPPISDASVNQPFRRPSALQPTLPTDSDERRKNAAPGVLHVCFGNPFFEIRPLGGVV